MSRITISNCGATRRAGKQVAAVADDIAYDAHDIDDGLRAGLFTVDNLAEIPLIADINAVIFARYPFSTKHGAARTGARTDLLSDRGCVFGNAKTAWRRAPCSAPMCAITTPRLLASRQEAEKTEAMIGDS